MVYTGDDAADSTLSVECVFNDDGDRFRSGKKGLIRRMMALTPEAKLMVEHHVMSGMQLPVEFLDIAQCGSYISENPERASDLLDSIDIPAMNSRFDGFGKLPETFRQKVAAQTMFER